MDKISKSNKPRTTEAAAKAGKADPAIYLEPKGKNRRSQSVASTSSNRTNTPASSLFDLRAQRLAEEPAITPISNPQTPESQPPATMSETSASPYVAADQKANFLPNPLSSHAPRFSDEEPETLERFFKGMEVIMAQAKLTSDKQKKETIVLYTEPFTEALWKSYKAFKDGTWEEFKERVFLEYPQARRDRDGSLRSLEDVVRKYRGIESHDMQEYLRFRRRFVVIAQKLLLPPEGISNRELVNKFLSCLSNSFVSSVMQRLMNLQSMKPEAIAGASGESSTEQTPRREEDRYKFDMVLQATNDIIDGYSNVLLLTGQRAIGEEVSSGTREIKTEFSALNEKVAKALDMLGLQQKEMQQMRSFQQSQSAGPAYNQQPTQSYPQRTQNVNPHMPENACYYCWEQGHRIGDCSKQRVHLDLGKIRIANGRTQMADGTNPPALPRDKSPWHRVEELLKNKTAASMYYDEFQVGTPGVLRMPPEYQPTSVYTQISESRDASMSNYERQVADMSATMQSQQQLIMQLQQQLRSQQLPAHMTTQVPHYPTAPSPAPVQTPPLDAQLQEQLRQFFANNPMPNNSQGSASDFP